MPIKDKVVRAAINKRYYEQNKDAHAERCRLYRKENPAAFSAANKRCQTYKKVFGELAKLCDLYD